MIIEGKLIEIMETFPLQLSIETEDKKKHTVTLDPNANTIKQGKTLDVNKLKLEQQIRVKGKTLKSGANIIESIEIL
ncbi:hypothetical protein ACP6PL_06090 [Dapis sp. BLCC M126]|uniref:hypothetical protein n=1 Tax=Dapis sp. BLCC M126 TaxID=3400189 RepID=UPI003CE6FE34